MWQAEKGVGGEFEMEGGSGHLQWCLYQNSL